jgi:general secretion pathway protein M
MSDLGARFDRILARHRWAAVASYAGVLALLLGVTWWVVSDLYERQTALATAVETLDRLQARGLSSRTPGSAVDPERAGSPFLEGETLTVAGAALLQRVASAVKLAGGNVLSSQVDLQGTAAKDGFIALTVSCELDQAALQGLLHDIEAGMPFLFVDQLIAQTPAAAAEGRKMQVMLTVSGKWQGK